VGLCGLGSSIPTTTSGSAEPVEKEEAETPETAAADVLPLVERVEGAGDGERVHEDVSVHMTTTMAEERVDSDIQLLMFALKLPPQPATTTAATTTTWLIPWTWYPLSAPTPTSVGALEAETEMEKAEQDQQEGADCHGDNDNI